MYNVEQRLIIITEWISLAEDCVKRYHYQLFISFRITVSLKTLRFSLPASINLWREYLQGWFTGGPGQVQEAESSTGHQVRVQGKAMFYTLKVR